MFFSMIADTGIAKRAAPGGSDLRIGLLRARGFKQTPALQVNCCKFQYNLVQHVDAIEQVFLNN